METMVNVEKVVDGETIVEKIVKEGVENWEEILMVKHEGLCKKVPRYREACDLINVNCV